MTVDLLVRWILNAMASDCPRLAPGGLRLILGEHSAYIP